MCYTPKLLLYFYTLAFVHQEHLVPLTDTEEAVWQADVCVTERNRTDGVTRDMQCVIADAGMHAHPYIPALSGCFQPKPKPNIFCYGWKKKVLYHGMYNISCRGPRRLFWLPKNTVSRRQGWIKRAGFPLSRLRLIPTYSTLPNLEHCFFFNNTRPAEDQTVPAKKPIIWV